MFREPFPIDYWFDATSLSSTLATTFKTLALNCKPVAEANVLVLLPPVMPGMPQDPEGVTTQFYRFSTHAP